MMTMNQLHNQFQKASTEFNPNEINLQDGVYNIVDKEFYPHNGPKPFNKPMAQLPFDYAPANGCANIDRWFNELFEDDPLRHKLAYEMLGYCMLQQAPLQRMFYVCGPARTGKSLFLEILSNFLGQTNVSYISTEFLFSQSDDQCIWGNLYGKLANIAPTSIIRSKGPSKLSAQIKNLIAGEPMVVRKKYGDPFAMTPFTTVILEVNESPHTMHPSLESRLSILPFLNEDLSLDLPEINEIEYAGLFNKALGAILPLLGQRQFAKPEFPTYLKAEFVDSSVQSTLF